MFQHAFTAELGIISVAVLTELLIHEISAAATEPTRRARSLIENELLPQFSERGR
jgi:hypothetical protein